MAVALGCKPHLGQINIQNIPHGRVGPQVLRSKLRLSLDWSDL